MSAEHRPTVEWVVDVMGDGVDLTDPVQVAVAGYQQIQGHTMPPVVTVRLADGSVHDVDLMEPAAGALL